MTVDVETFRRQANWFVHSVTEDRAFVVQVDRSIYDASSFLDTRMAAPAQADTFVTSFSALAPLFAGQRDETTRYIFHLSHVGSTLVSRAIGLDPTVLSLREPLLLRWLAKSRLEPTSLEPAALRAYDQHLATTLGLLSRPLPPANEVVVKATSYANAIAADILRIQPRARAIAVYLGLDDFVTAILKSASGWGDIARQAPFRLRRLHDLTGESFWNLDAMSPGEVIAMSWMLETVTLKRAGSAHSGQLQWMDFQQFLETPESSLAQICEHFGLGWSETHEHRLRTSGVLDQYSKGRRSAYDAATRAAEMKEARQTHGDEIRRAHRWFEAARAAHPDFEGLMGAPAWCHDGTSPGP